jgi:hypothetical protein
VKFHPIIFLFISFPALFSCGPDYHPCVYPVLFWDDNGVSHSMCISHPCVLTCIEAVENILDSRPDLTPGEIDCIGNDIWWQADTCSKCQNLLTDEWGEGRYADVDCSLFENFRWQSMWRH